MATPGWLSPASQSSRAPSQPRGRHGAQGSALGTGIDFPPGLTADQQLDLLLAQQAREKAAEAQARARPSSPFNAVSGAGRGLSPSGAVRGAGGGGDGNPFTPPGVLDVDMAAEIRGMFEDSLSRLPRTIVVDASSRSASDTSRKRQLIGGPNSPRGILTQPFEDQERECRNDESASLTQWLRSRRLRLLS